MKNQPALHGRDHLRGGSDPIPFVPGIKWAICDGFGTAPAVNDDPPRGVASACSLNVITNDPNLFRIEDCPAPWDAFSGLQITEPGYYFAMTGVTSDATTLGTWTGVPSDYGATHAQGYSVAGSGFLTPLTNVTTDMGFFSFPGFISYSFSGAADDGTFSTFNNFPFHHLDPVANSLTPILGAFNTTLGADWDYTYGMTVFQLGTAVDQV